MHPSDELLAGFAGGDADVPRRALLEGHLGHCSQCRSAIAELTVPGGVLLHALGGEAPPEALWGRLRERVVALPSAQTADRLLSREGARLPLPSAVRGELGALETPLRPAWRWLDRGVRYAPLAVDPLTKSSLLLVHSSPGRWMPEHVHVSEEELLVVAGGFTDTQGRHEVGDFTTYPAGSIHHPLTDDDGECWCLVRVEKPNRFFGWQGWLQRWRAA